MKSPTQKRSALKAASWRVIASLDTFVISYIITGRASMASTIAGIEILTKMILYYMHERGWSKIKWGIENNK